MVIKKKRKTKEKKAAWKQKTKKEQDKNEKKSQAKGKGNQRKMKQNDILNIERNVDTSKAGDEKLIDLFRPMEHSTHTANGTLIQVSMNK